MPPVGNFYDKYSTKNIFVKTAVRNFLKNISDCIKSIPIQSILDVGCGEGYVTNVISSLEKAHTVEAVDVSQDVVDTARGNYPHIRFSRASADDLPYEDSSFDLVASLETLEHLEDVKPALSEIIRVSSRFVLLSVPMEPFFRIITIIGGKYWNRLGNTPGHLQHWTKRSFVKLVSSELEVTRDYSAFPWTVLLCKKR